MNNLTVPWGEEDRINVRNMIAKLFLFQGMRMSKEQAAETQEAYVEELSAMALPTGPVLAGINDLLKEDLRSVKLHHIIEAAKSHFTHEEETHSQCERCDGRGIVMMRNKDWYQFALACVCVNGDAFASRGNARWNGQQFQESKRHGTLELEYAKFVLGLK